MYKIYTCNIHLENPSMIHIPHVYHSLYIIYFLFQWGYLNVLQLHDVSGKKIKVI
jgi:hypothetical protein